MKKRSTRSALLSALILIPALAAGCSGGGGGGGGITFTVLNVAPSISNDLNGGDLVSITGTNFVTVNVANVKFAGFPGTIVSVTDTEIRVTTPPAPFGNPGLVTVEIISTGAGSKQLFNAYHAGRALRRAR
jgi:hypothetical protein